MTHRQRIEALKRRKEWKGWGVPVVRDRRPPAPKSLAWWERWTRRLRGNGR